MFSKSLLRLFLGITNVLFFITGGTAMGVGVWFAMDKIFLADIIGSDLFSAASYLMIFCGACILLLSFLGCAATVFESKKMLIGYCAIVIIILIVYISAAIIAAVFQGEMEGNLSSRMRTTLTTKYGYQTESNSENKRITDAWDYTQQTLRCCAVEDKGYALYRETHWYREQVMSNLEPTNIQYIPKSCCVYLEHRQEYQNIAQCQYNPFGPPTSTDTESARNDNMYYTGCLTQAKNFAVDNAGIILAIGFGFSFVLIAGIVFSILLMRKLGVEFQPVSTKDLEEMDGRHHM